MRSVYLNKLTPQQRHDLIAQLHAIQDGNCFICERPIDLAVQADSMDIDHIEPLSGGGKDDPSNFGLTHASCNRSKQASDLRVARVLARFERIKEDTEKENRSPNLADVLVRFGGAKFDFGFDASDEDSVRFSFDLGGDPNRQGVSRLPGPAQRSAVLLHQRSHLVPPPRRPHQPAQYRRQPGRAGRGVPPQATAAPRRPGLARPDTGFRPDQGLRRPAQGHRSGTSWRDPFAGPDLHRSRPGSAPHHQHQRRHFTSAGGVRQVRAEAPGKVAVH